MLFLIHTRRPRRKLAVTAHMTIVIFYPLTAISLILLPMSRRVTRASLSCRNIAASAGTSARFAAAQKPSPLAWQALGSGQTRSTPC